MTVKAQRRRRALRLAVPLVIVAALGLGALLWRGPEPGGIDDAYTLLFGEPDLGPVDFAAIRRRMTKNDALACPPSLCGAAADLASPVFPVPRERLRAIVTEVAATEPDTDVVASTDGEQDRYVVRTRLMRYPDTVNVRIIDLGDGRSSVAIYSRSQIGLFDFGVNRARVQRWLRRIGVIAAQPPPVSEG